MVGIYVRTSTLKQSKKYSPGVQREKGKLFAESINEGYLVFEESVSGGSLDRIKLKELFNKIVNGIVDKVWVIEQSRISRDMEDSTYISSLFVKHKCELYIDGEFVDLTSSRSRFFYNISSAVSDYERSEIKARMKRGRDKSFDLGKKVISRCYGFTYEWVEGKRHWIIDKEQGKIVKKIFEMYVNDNFSLSRIVYLLNNKGVKTYYDSLWSDRTIKEILCRKEYAGLTTDSNNSIIKSEIYEPIISVEMWETSCKKINIVREKYNIRKQKFRYNTGALTHIIKCKSCGQPFKFRSQVRKYDGVKGKSTYEREIYYHARGITCENQKPKMFYRHQLESAFELAYLFTFINEKNRNQWLDNKKQELEHFNDSHKVDISSINIKLAECEKKINNLINALTMGVATENIKNKIEIIESEKDTLISKKENINNEYLLVLSDYQDAEQYFFTDVIKQVTEFEAVEKRKLYNNIVEYCYVSGNKMEIKFITGETYYPEIDTYHKQASEVLKNLVLKHKSKRNISKKNLDSHLYILSTMGEVMKKDPKSYKEKLGDENTKKGGHCFGFNSKKNTAVCSINEEEAEIAKIMFDLMDKGETITGVEKYLRSNNYKKKRGNNNWSRRDVRLILSRLQLSGRWYNSQGDIIESFRFPQIIKPEQFDRVKIILDRNRDNSKVFSDN